MIIRQFIVAVNVYYSILLGVGDRVSVKGSVFSSKYISWRGKHS